MPEMENLQSNKLKPKTHVLFVGIVLAILNVSVSSSTSSTSSLAADSRVTQQVLMLLFAVAFNVLTVFWCAFDSRERGETSGRYFTLAVVIFGVFTLFYYFFKTRGFKGGLISTGKFIALFLGTTFVSAIIFAVIETFVGG
jgi:hypothetical protein